MKTLEVITLMIKRAGWNNEKIRCCEVIYGIENLVDGKIQLEVTKKDVKENIEHIRKHIG